MRSAITRAALSSALILGLLAGWLGLSWSHVLLIALFAGVVSGIGAWLWSRPLQEILHRLRQEVPEAAIPARDEVQALAVAVDRMMRMYCAQLSDLERRHRRLRAILTQMTDGVIITNPNGRVELINPAAARMFEQDGDRARGQSFAQVVRHHSLIRLWQQCREGGEPQSASLEWPSEKRFLHAVATPLEEALHGYVLVLIQDLTPIRRLETIRRDFIANLSHELRTPLASLKALAETLRTGALEDPPAARRFLASMEQEVDALAQMVSELLDLSRIESGQAQLTLKAVSPQAMVEEAVARMRPQAERAGLTLSAEVGDLPPVRADAELLGRVLINLLHNAIKFTQPGGWVKVHARQEGDMVMFMVQDTGVGIPAEDLPRIFERFYKADRARTGGGTGLGLSIARHIVEAHGGRIWAESEPGKGSIFYFMVPQA